MINQFKEYHSTIEDIYVACVDTGRGHREVLRIYDTRGLEGNIRMQQHYLQFPDGFILVYNPSDRASLDMLAGIKSDIDKFKDKKEVTIIVIANVRSKSLVNSSGKADNTNTQDYIDSTMNRANDWCAREKIKHYTVNAKERASLYEPFIGLAIRIHPPQTKSGFPQLSKLTQKTSKAGET